MSAHPGMRERLIAAGLAVAGSMAMPAAAAPKQPYTRNVAIVVYEGVEILDFAGPAEVFAAAAGFGSSRNQQAFNVYTVAVSADPLKTNSDVTIKPAYAIADAPEPDIVVIPGGNTASLLHSDAFMSWLKSASAHAEITMTVCTGAFTVAKLGLLDGKQATTWYGAIPALRSATPKATVVEGRRFIDNGSIITTAGVSAGIDGSLHAVARLLGRQVADRTAQYMEYHWTPEPYLAQHYVALNPSLDDEGRRLQQASILEDEKSWADAAAAYRSLIERNPDDTFAWYRLGATLHAAGQYDAAIDAARHATGAVDLRANAFYNIACAQALQGKKDAALDSLKQSVAAGFKAKGSLERDPDLAGVRDDARFKELLASM